MSSGFEEVIQRLEGRINLLLTLPASWRTNDGVLIGDNTFADATWISRDELVEQERERLAKFVDMDSQLVS